MSVYEVGTRISSRELQEWICFWKWEADQQREAEQKAKRANQAPKRIGRR